MGTSRKGTANFWNPNKYFGTARRTVRSSVSYAQAKRQVLWPCPARTCRRGSFVFVQLALARRELGFSHFIRLHLDFSQCHPRTGLSTPTDALACGVASEGETTSQPGRARPRLASAEAGREGTRTHCLCMFVRIPVRKMLDLFWGGFKQQWFLI